MGNVVSSAKTDMFRIRMNPEIREELERIYAKNGLTLTDAVNVFFQQSLNAGGFPFAVNEDPDAEAVAEGLRFQIGKELRVLLAVFLDIRLHGAFPADERTEERR